MAKREAKDVMLYFRSVANEDNDDGAETAATNLTSLLIPASRLRAMNPTSDILLSLSFDSVKNTEGADNTDSEVTVADTVALSISSNQHREVMNGIVAAINGSSTGLVVVADDVTTNVAGNVVTATYVHPSITGIATDAIVCAAAHS
tara:strand:+ start:688 stop:1128 length:441 start_codon:yes stop_codon:yes gene_type:complete